MHHRNCGGEFEIRGYTDYGESDGCVFGVLPDFYCSKCDDFLAGDAQIAESMDELQFEPNKYDKKAME